MLYSSTLISLIEVILIFVPTLLVVAYTTVAERKTMASMQRRLGPNQVGQHEVQSLHINKLFSSSYPFSKLIYTSYSNLSFSNQFRTFYSNNSPTPNKNILDSLFKSRLAPVIPFNHSVLITCKNITDSADKDIFFTKLSDLMSARQENGLGVIYIFQ